MHHFFFFLQSLDSFVVRTERTLDLVPAIDETEIDCVRGDGEASLSFRKLQGRILSRDAEE